MKQWQVEFHEEFEAEFADLSLAVREELLARALMLEEFGPALGRPAVDTLNASKHANMKELRFEADHGVWRVAFAFDPGRKGILLVAGDKSGAGNGKRFYKQLIAKADRRFDEHLKATKQVKGKKGKNKN
ncbi:conserved hypothetical protein [Parvibaculum lavamentivorans DS-1]|uniref:Addiction module toxin RelE n=1 Tax=Parvibaculum lavamentivorans (strain DS-1 / DSM 13023 / NCIMB 13966) TaxID=402881 RepID=A7HQS5_PARL1|nr:type II toxin-antitoxin system RelE/ParE family toxin [Parvibaculum lavamentivorans]ABS62258.1 conserved hypothetical protein [Parvibaculum lavamentivorans DS-1]